MGKYVKEELSLRTLLVSFPQTAVANNWNSLNFNSPEAVELVHENYKDERTIQKIEKCLNLLNKEFDLTQIAKKIEEYRKIVNKHARKIFINLKDCKYP